jgi:phosphopantothenoylcysteine decarboxylase/phosphopantothenate--cysteine ligase
MFDHPLYQKKIVLGVTGSIAAYKAIDLASKLTQAGAQVQVLLSDAAQRFVTPLAFQAVTGQPALHELWDSTAHVRHVQLGESADLLLIAPATADFMAKCAHGLADDLLSVTYLAARCPVLFAPAMDGGMWEHAATQANVVALQARGAVFLGPTTGRMASGLQGVGRMLEPLDLLAAVRWHFARGGGLAGQTVVVTAGGTQEAIDPVRFISNHSSGKQGFAIAQAALDLGAQVTLIATPTAAALPTPYGATRVTVTTAAEMLDAVLAHAAQASALVMAAAVADYRPEQVAQQKLKREQQATLALTLTRNPDILLAVAERKAQTGYPRVTIGFAAESQALLANAQSKLHRKKLDLLVANDISAPDAGFFVDTNRVLLVSPTVVQELPLQSKAAVGTAICAWLLERLGQAGVA